MHGEITTLIFDLDGTLYVDLALGSEVKRSAACYIAALKAVSVAEADFMIEEARSTLSAASGRTTTLSQACELLGGTLAGLHARFAADIKPERFLVRNHRLVELLTGLSQRYDLCIYTNNNVTLTEGILAALGLTGLFGHIFTIENFWQPKPSREALGTIFQRLARRPEQCLFIGDRYDIDLRLPAEMGAAVFLVGSTEELFPLCRLLEEGL